MREIKFRAWHPKDKRWIPYVGWGEAADHFGTAMQDGTFELHGHEDFCIYSQYTGLKDKNGKEIYEGDIVCYVTDEVVEVISGHPRTEPEGNIGGVEFSNGAFFVNGDGFYSYGEQDFLWSELEIIGNIYETSELITTT